MNVVLYGNGAMARLLFSFAKQAMNIVAFTVDDECINPGEISFCGLPLVPFSLVQRSFEPANHAMVIAVGFLEMNDLRERKFQEATKKGYCFESYVHESVLRHDDVVIEENCIVLDHVSIHVGCRIGRGTFISSNVNIGHDCQIGHSSWINSGVSIAGGCTIGTRSFFGVNASVGHNVLVGEQNFIGANTLITCTTQDAEVYLSEPGMKFKLNSKAFLKFSPALSPRP